MTGGPPARCHLTVKSIAKSQLKPSTTTINEWITLTQSVIESFRPFIIHLQDIDWFSNTVVAKVDSSSLIELHKKLCTVLPSGQPHYENEAYIPHVSIATCSMSEKINESINKKCKVQNIELVIWDLHNLKKPEIVHQFTLTKT